MITNSDLAITTSKHLYIRDLSHALHICIILLALVVCTLICHQSRDVKRFKCFNHPDDSGALLKLSTPQPFSKRYLSDMPNLT